MTQAPVSPEAPHARPVGVLKRALRQVRARPRLATAIALGVTVLILLPSTVSGPTRALIAWDTGAALYLALAWTMMLRASIEHMATRARMQDDGAVAVLTLTVTAGFASLAAILLELIGIKSRPPDEQTLRFALAGVTIICSWFTVHTSFALHYAHEYYMRASRTDVPCLQFPGSGPPNYVDFLYFAFVLGTTSQTSDVAISTHRMRRLALTHGVIAFFFNATLLALVVNIAAGLT